MSDKTVTLNIEISDALCADILCGAIEGGTGYWAVLDHILRQRLTAHEPPHKFGDPTEDGEVGWPWEYVSAEFSDTEFDEDDPDAEPAFEPQVVTYDTIREGIRKVLAPDADINSRTRGYIFAGVIGNDGGEIDADAADAIVQFGMFGKLVFG